MMFTKEEIDYLNELLLSAIEWDDEPPTELINNIFDKLEDNTRKLIEVN